jgi:hypothetical protein
MTFTDSLGVDIEATDTVFVNGWGYGARLIDTGIRSRVVRFSRTRVVIIDSENQERAVGPSNLAVLRRDGATGFEGNRHRA